MHRVLIIVLLMLAFPVFARFVGSILLLVFLSMLFWLIVAAIVL